MADIGNILKITFTDTPLENSKLEFQLETGITSSTTITETFNEIDTGSFSVQIKEGSVGKQAQVYKEALEADYPGQFTVTATDFGEVEIISLTSSVQFYNFTQENLVDLTGTASPVLGADGVYSVPFVQTRTDDQQIISDGVLSRSPKFTFSNDFTEQQRNRMTFTFSANVSATEQIVFDAIRNGSTVRTFNKTFHASTNSSTLIPVGDSIGQTILNMKANFQEFDDLFYYEYIIDSDSDKLYLDIFDDTPAPNWSITTNTTTIAGATAAGTFSETSTRYDVFTWEGSYDGIGITGSTTPIFSKSKQKIIDSQTKTYIDFTPLVRSGLEFDINQYLRNFPRIDKIASGTGRWARVDTYNQIFGYDRENVNENFYYITDGWTTPIQVQNIPNILTTGNHKIYDQGSMAKLYFKTQNLQKVEVSERGGFGPIPTEIEGIFGTFSESNQYINSVRLTKNLYNTGNFQDYIFSYGTNPSNITDVFTILVDWLEECYYIPIDVYFKNKFGVIETISFNKVHKRSLKRKSEDFKRSIVNIEGVYDVKRHSLKERNVQGDFEWTLNTDWIPESMNSQFEELFMSEEVWIAATDTNEFGQISKNNSRWIVPVVLTDRNFKYKATKNGDRIQYTVKVEYSHGKINNIR